MQATSEATGSLVGLREAARLLTESGKPISHSTLSRQIERGQIPNRGTPTKPLVNIDEVIRSRAANIDPRLQRQPQPAPLLPSTAAETPPVANAASMEVNTHRADLERTKARLAQLDLEQKLGNLLDKRDVVDAVETVSRALRDQLLAVADTLAPDLAGLTDAAEIRVKIEEAHRKVLMDMVKGFKRMAAVSPGESSDAA